MIGTMGKAFASENLADCRIVAVDSSLIYAVNRRIWHKKHMIQNIMPRSGIDTDARWGFARTKGWVFGYKIHMCCSTGRCQSHCLPSFYLPMLMIHRHTADWWNQYLM
jgi:hypothetical protein